MDVARAVAALTRSAPFVMSAPASGRSVIEVCIEIAHAAAVAELATRFAESPKGEVTLVFGAAPVAGADPAAAADAVAQLVAAGLPRRQAAEVVAGLTGVSRNRLYRTSL